VSLLHFFELVSFLNPGVLVFLFSLSSDTLCLHDVVVDVSLDLVAHRLHVLLDRSFFINFLGFLTGFFISKTFFLPLIHLVTFNID
jgi:hypothetical protein